MTSLAELAKKAEKFTVDNSPLLLTVIGSVGVMATATLATTATIKAVRLYDEDAKSREFYNKPAANRMDVFKMMWPLYLPTAGTVLATGTAVVMANRISTTRAAALAAAYSMSEKAFKDYREKVADKFGEKKEQQVRDEILQDRVNAAPDHGKLVIVAADEQLCYDSLSGRWFNGSVEEIKHAQNKLNHQINQHGYASLSEFYDEIGLPPTAISEEMGWNDRQLMEIYFGTCLAPSGKPAIAVEYRVQPIRNYFRMS